MEVQIKVPIVSELAAENKTFEYLFWVGSVGSFDERIKKSAGHLLKYYFIATLILQF
jgi:hypothetical protein